MRDADSAIRLCLAPGFVEAHVPQWGSGFTGCIGEGHGRVCETFASNWAGPQPMPWSTRLSGHPGTSSKPQSRYSRAEPDPWGSCASLPVLPSRDRTLVHASTAVNNAADRSTTLGPEETSTK